jgi:CheY-like chemotaxis protein
MSGLEPRSPPSAEQDVAEYFRSGAAEAESEGLMSRLLGWLSPGGVAEGEGAAAAEAQARKKVLVVDDEPDGVEALVRMFSKSGYDAESVSSAEAAMASIRAERPAVVLLDIMMPGTDGVELLKTLRADPATATLPVLMLTANHRRVLEAFTSGAQDYLMKPVDFPKVRASVERQVGGGEGER